MDEEGETDELNEMSLLLKGWGGMRRRFRAFSQVQSVTCVELCGCIFCSNTCRPGVRKMSKRTVCVYHCLPHVRAREG